MASIIVGRAAAELLVERGARVTVFGAPGSADGADPDLAALPDGMIAIVGDGSNADEVYEAVGRAAEHGDGLDILVCSAAIHPYGDAALFVLTFLGGWTQYLWPLVASSTPNMQTAVVGLARLAPDMEGVMPDFPLIMAGAVVVSIIPLVMIAVLQRYLVRGLVLSEK